MRLLFVKNSLVWPRSSGHDVHTYYMMKACADLGHEIALATVIDPEGPAIAGLPLFAKIRLGGSRPASTQPPIHATTLQRKFRNYWGVPESQLATLQGAVRDLGIDAAIVVGLEVLSYFPALEGTTRVWYAADEWVLHHLSQVRFGSRALAEDLRAAVVKGLYERAHRSLIDRVWVVSESDRTAMRIVAGVKNIDVLPNGVDGQYFRPADVPATDRSAVFWGRLDFGPNIQALEWFCGKVWPIVRSQVPDATFTIVGFQPGDNIRALAKAPGVHLEANLPDLRSAVSRRSIAVLPFVSGAGIKNKLLEAAAMGLPSVCTPKTARGLRGNPPLVTAATPGAFADAMISLWQDADRRRQIGAASREWVLTHHTWNAVAKEAMTALEAMPRARP